MKSDKELHLEFRKQAFLDLDAMKCLYKAGNYGNSAYHAQQSMEKLVKAIILKDDPNAGVKDIGHLVCSKKLLTTFQARINKIGESDPSYWKELGQTVNDCIHGVKDLFKESKEWKTAWWMYSLGVGRFADNSKFEYNFKKLETAGTRLSSFVALVLIPPFWKLYGRPSNQKKINQKRIDEILSYKDEYVREITGSDTTSRLCKQILETLPADIQHPDTFIRQIVLILNFSGLFLKLYPHEETGRYPESINGMSSLQMYEEFHEYLSLLEQEVEDAFKELDSMFFSDNLDT